MRVSCPACGAELTLDVMLSHEAARRAVAAAMKISAPLADRLMKYLALFRPAQRQLTMDRLASLLAELLPMIEAQRVKRGTREYATDVEDWKCALDTVLAHRDDGRLKLPLKSHGYLLEVLCATCERWERGEENRREAELRSGRRDLQARAQAESVLADLAQAADALPPLPAGPREAPAEFKQLFKSLGRRGGGGDPA